MAVASTSQILHDGPRRLVMQFTGICDGLGDESNAIKVHMADLTPIPRSVSIEKISYDVSGGLLQLLWDGVPTVPFLVLSNVNVMDYSPYKLNNNAGDTATGDILFSTMGFDAGSSYSIIMEMMKKFP